MRRCSLSLPLVSFLIACTGDTKNDEFGVPYGGEPSSEGLPTDTDTEDTDVVNDSDYQVGMPF